MEHISTFPLPQVTLVLGGARSGKSTHAERLVTGTLHGGAPRPAVYIATAEAGDVEMATRIMAHRTRRGAVWTTIEEPLKLADVLEQAAAKGQPMLVDCLTLWLSNLLIAGKAAAQAEAGEAIACPLFRDETTALMELLPQLPGHIILVSNEVGWGIVPMHPVSRLFADEQGRLNQRVAGVCDQVTLVAAGLPLSLKHAAV